MIDHVHALPEGYRLQEYSITGTLGFGGFGITYSALDTNLDKIVAIKEYLPGELATRVAGNTVSVKSEQDRESFNWGLDAFLNEAKTVAKFDHPNVVRIYRFFEQNGTGYIVMELIKGRTLSSVLKEKGTLEESEIRSWLWPVMEGLKIVHSSGYLHRDIKPQNIMMRTDGRPCVLDFGAARLAMGGMTRSLTAIMTPGFAPLEQYQTRGNQGPWTDIYALGAVIYSCVSGKKPMDALDRISNDSMKSADSESHKTYSTGILRGITAALSMKEEDRPQSIDALFKILDAPEQEPTIAMPKLPKVEPSAVATRKMPEKPEPSPPQSKPSPQPPKFTHANVPSEKPATSESKRTAKWFVIALLPILVMIIAFGVYWWMVGREVQPVNQVSSTEGKNEFAQVVQETAPKHAPEPVYEGINVRSEPSGANIYIDGEFVAVTPANIKSIEAGQSATVRLELEGYEPNQRVVTAPNTGSGDVSLTLLKIIQKYSLTIKTEPADATVRILNIEPRYTPGILLELGRYHVEVSKPGYITETRWVEMAGNELRDVVERVELIKGWQTGEAFKDCNDCPEMVVIPVGSFQMGTPEGEWNSNESPQHRVTISQPFALGKYEVTVGEFKRFISATNYANEDWRNPGFSQSDSHPVTGISWHDATAYASWLARTTGESYRLPSEAEWEYAARAGTATDYWWGNTITCSQAAYGGSVCNRRQTEAVGSFRANAIGLFDVHGNVWEWTEDCRNESYADAPIDGSAWTRGNCSIRVLRGGSWDSHQSYLRAANRNGSSLSNRNNNFGFRLARTL